MIIRRLLQRLGDIVVIMRRLQMPMRVVALLFALNLFASLCEGLGVAMLLPVFQLLQAGGTIGSVTVTGAHWQILNSVADDLGIKISLGLLLSISFFLILLRQGVNYINVRQQSRVQRGAADRIRQHAFNAYLRASTKIQDQIRLGDVANDMTTELGRALGSLFAAVQWLGRSVQLLIYLSGLFILSVPMTLLSISVIGFAAFLARGMLADVKRSGQAITKANSDLTSFIVERLHNTRLIRLSGTERAESNAFAKLSQIHARRAMWQTMLSARMSLLPEPIAIGFAYLVLYIGGTVIGLSLDLLGMFVVVLIRLMPIVRGLAGDYNNIMGKWPSVIKVSTFLKSIRAAQEPRGGAETFTSLEREIAYDRVSFSYPQASGAALDQVTVTLPARRMIALVGPSGAGKSTFVDLLPRIWELSSGEIRFDGTPIAKFSTDSLRAGIAFVPQQPQIFNISPAEHIRYGKEDASDAEVREAARLAGALTFIDALPDGFATLLNDGGKRLSGGQRQRLDIARALVRRAPILILDEPTSALDADAEAAFRDALQTLRRETDLTIIVIAHRLSTVADADKIVVLNEGRVEAFGSHAELIGADNWYSRAFAKQFGARGPQGLDLAIDVTR